MKTRILKYLVINSIYSAAIYFAIFEGINGAENIVIAATWLLLFGSALCLTEPAAKIFKNTRRSVPKWFDGLFDFSVICVFIYSGWWWTGIAYIIHFVFMSLAWERAKIDQAADEEGTPC